MRKPDTKKRLSKIKTGRIERQWSVAKAGITAGTSAATQMWGSAFLGKEKRQARNKRILSEQAQYLADELGKLKGSVVKVGQIMALYGEHILPEEVTNALRTLEEQTIALDWPVIEKALQTELGESFSDFVIEQQPIGAASLAQVHKAVHKPTGESVCLKVQYPGVAEAIDSDLNSVVRLLKLSRLVTSGNEFQAWIDELRQLLHYEVDYHREAAMTMKFVERLGTDNTFRVPQIYAQYCTSKLLVSSFEAGFAVNDPAVQALPQVERNRLGCAFLQLFVHEVFDWGELQTDPNFGNYRIQMTEAGRARIVLLDFGAVLSYSEDFLGPLKAMILGACQHDYPRVRAGAIALGMMKEEYPEEVHRDFAALCSLLVEPFVFDVQSMPAEALNSEGQYRWANSRLPKRAAKKAATSAMSKYFAVPPKEFAFLSRKLLGVYSFIAALEAEFNPDQMLVEYY